MRMLTDHISSVENECRCGCGRFGLDYELAIVLELWRARYGEVMRFNRMFSCQEHNNRPKNEKNERGQYGCGSKSTSRHPDGTAADFKFDNVTPITLFKDLDSEYPTSYGIGVYDWGVHLDVRTKRARWDERSVN